MDVDPKAATEPTPSTGTALAMPPGFLPASLVSGVVIASASYAVTSLAVRSFLGTDGGLLVEIVVGVGAVVMSCVVGWFTQPLVSHLLRRLS